MRISLTDEGGKVDINNAPRELPNVLFLAAGAEQDQTASLIDAILDFRDEDNLNRLNGAEDRDYQAIDLTDAKNSLFEAIGELRGVLGITPGLFQRASTLATVFSSQTGINPLTAQAALLCSALLCSALLRAMPGLDDGQVTEFL